MDYPIDIRAGTTEHFDDVCELARHLNTVNLPDSPPAIRKLLDLSERSFSGAVRDPLAREYVFVLYDARRKRVIGTSMVIAQLGNRSAPYIYLSVGREEKYSATLDRHFVHRVLTTRYNYDGPTEIGGLVMHPDFRRSPERLGSLIAYVRFLFIAMNRKLFRDELLAELLPPFEADGSSPLWEAYGRRFTGLSYREADQLSKINKEFVRSLFPDEIYATLLSDQAQRAIGEVGPETRGVEKMLRRIGFEYAERVDPFDGGPHFTCATDKVTLIQQARERPVAAISSGGGVGAAAIGGGARALLGRSFEGPPFFRAVPVFGGVSETVGGPAGNSGTGTAPAGGSKGESEVLVSAELLSRLGISDRGSAFWMPLPDR
ncbi:MAG TPA: arginine N-succinyltransferase [Lacunisphaera sp.]|nr:arginine N-succinyltransferase [Lacunisphaera sp.]